MTEADLPSSDPLLSDPPSEMQESQSRSKWPLVLATGASVLVFAAALVAPLVDRALRGDEQAQRARDLTRVQTWAITDRTHTGDDVTYAQDPPAGGPHADVWLACGAYDEPVREENAVHDLEHGTVWVTYSPSLSPSEVASLEAQLPDNGILSPREGLPSPVVITVWGAQLHLRGAYDRRIGVFVEEYGDGHTAPERGVGCQGGTSDPAGSPTEAGVNA